MSRAAEARRSALRSFRASPCSPAAESGRDCLPRLQMSLRKINSVEQRWMRFNAAGGSQLKIRARKRPGRRSTAPSHPGGLRCRAVTTNRAKARLALVLYHQRDHVTALLTSKGQQLRMRPEVGFPALQLHGPTAQFTTGRHERRCRGRLHVLPFNSGGGFAPPADLSRSSIGYVVATSRQDASDHQCRPTPAVASKLCMRLRA